MQDTGPEIQEAERALAGAVHEMRTAATAWAIRTNLDDPTGDNKGIAIALGRTSEEHDILARGYAETALRALGRYLGCDPQAMTAMLSDATRTAS